MIVAFCIIVEALPVVVVVNVRVIVLFLVGG